MALEQSAIEWTINHGLKFPFFRFTTQFPSYWAAMNAIMADLSNRSGLDHAINQIDVADRDHLAVQFETALNATTGSVKQRAERIRFLLSCFGGFDGEWDQTDADIRAEILTAWEDYITYAFEHKEALPSSVQLIQQNFVRAVEGMVDDLTDDLLADQTETYHYMRKAAKGVLEIIEGKDGHKGYHLYSREFAVTPELDLSQELQALFDNINS